MNLKINNYKMELSRIIKGSSIIAIPYSALNEVLEDGDVVLVKVSHNDGSFWDIGRLRITKRGFMICPESKDPNWKSYTVNKNYRTSQYPNSKVEVHAIVISCSTDMDLTDEYYKEERMSAA